MTAVRRRGIFSGRGRNPSYSFVDYLRDRSDVGSSIFVHVTEFASGEFPPPGTLVSFEVGVNRGRPCAIRVEVET